MDRRWGLVAVAGVLFAVLLASVSTAGSVRFWHEPATGDEPVATQPPTTETAPATTAPGETEQQPGELPAWLRIFLQSVVVAVLLAVVVAALVFGWHHRPRVRWKRDEPDADFAVLPDVARAVTDEAEVQRAALLHGSPRNAIVECWARLEAAVVSAGMRRDDADTPTEFTARVLGAYEVDATSISVLADLYREARFSTHRMDEGQRERAIAALDALHRALRDRMSQQERSLDEVGS